MMSRLCQTLILALALLLVCQLTEANYRKPPFNGSIFGKRASQAVSEYEQSAGATKALSSLCEVVAESCAAWFPSADRTSSE